jgi:plasmid stabilization system protein ParE
VVAAVQSEMIAPALTRRLRGENVPDVYAWTVNDETSVRRVANHGVHGIVTDEPEEATRVVRAMRATCDAPLNPESPPRSGAAEANPARPRASARGRKASPGKRGRDEG